MEYKTNKCLFLFGNDHMCWNLIDNQFIHFWHIFWFSFISILRTFLFVYLIFFWICHQNRRFFFNWNFCCFTFILEQKRKQVYKYVKNALFLIILLFSLSHPFNALFFLSKRCITNWSVTDTRCCTSEKNVDGERKR